MNKQVRVGMKKEMEGKKTAYLRVQYDGTEFERMKPKHRQVFFGFMLSVLKKKKKKKTKQNPQPEKYLLFACEGILNWLEVGFGTHCQVLSPFLSCSWDKQAAKQPVCEKKRQ